MIAKRRSALFYIFLAVAAAVSLWGLIRIGTVPDVLEYAIDYAHAPQVTVEENGQKTHGILNAFEDFRDTYPKEDLTVFVLKGSLVLTGEQNRTDTVTMYGVSEGFFDVYHHTLLYGRYFDREETWNGGKVLILNESAAFTLFGEKDAVGQQVTVGSDVYTVVGVVRRETGMLESQAGVVFLPLYQVEGSDIEHVVLSLKGQSALAAFETNAENALGSGGSTYSLFKEKLRARIGLRFLWIFFALTRMPAVFRFFNRITADMIEKIREKKKRCYFSRLLPRIALTALWCAVSYGLLIFIVYLIARAGLSCAEVFTEFMPEDPTDWNSILKVARSIHGMMSRWTVHATPLVRAVEGYGRLCFAGVVIFLLAWVLPGKREKQPERS